MKIKMKKREYVWIVIITVLVGFIIVSNKPTKLPIIAILTPPNKIEIPLVKFSSENPSKPSKLDILNKPITIHSKT